MSKIENILLIFLVLSGCSDSNDDWTQIDPLQPNIEVSKQLDTIISENNICLCNFHESSYHVIFNNKYFMVLDTCNEIPEIDFKNSTLIAGRIGVLSVSDRIADIILTSHNNEQYYDLTILLDKCVECYLGAGYIYYWVLFPKLNADYSFYMSVNEY